LALQFFYAAAELLLGGFAVVFGPVCLAVSHRFDLLEGAEMNLGPAR
jgi:hypothetical protein